MKEDTLKVTEKELLNAVNTEAVKGNLVNKFDKYSDYLELLIVKFVDAIPSIIGAILGLIIGLFIIRTILKIVRNRFEKRNVDMSLRGFLISVIQFILYAVLILVVIQNLGFETTAILGALSGLVLAVGLALQGSLSNFAGGVLILLFRPFEVGDYIENSAGTDGTVDKIDLLYTSLTTTQGIKVFSPNGALANSVIRNFSKITNRRFEYVVGIGYEDNIKTAQTVILNVLNSDARIIKEPAPEVFVTDLADSSVNLTIRAWASKDNYWPARNSLQQEIKVALDNAGINIPYPQQEMRIISDTKPNS
ncbi:mechanosensitive ion channel family protein [Myroides sp. JBRI-B21084]|uniref:mechanosensitive ion channel family protein n=1 Tax=Myroides sp. JBRI-B21084 TaxID=3119977 RepID=UPI0026E1B59C|nr:mechanosensitive ion channel family protein [Paenimyroides cloacae]WKW47011.1 mechanosensitive ion channel family protein [Paenimyroides cloacae]